MIASPCSPVSTRVEGDTISVSTIAHMGLQPNPASVQQTILIQVRVSTVTSRLVTVPASGWQGTGPYWQDVIVSGVSVGDELVVYVDHTASLMQRVAECNSILRASIVSSNTVRVHALSIKPKVDIPIRITSGMTPVRLVTVPAVSWQGTGPWIATVDVGTALATAVAGPIDSASDEQVQCFVDSGIHVMRLSGNNVTFRAVLEKPAIDMLLGLAGV